MILNVEKTKIRPSYLLRKLLTSICNKHFENFVHNIRKTVSFEENYLVVKKKVH